MTTYKEITNEIGYTYIERTDADGKVWSIPTDPANSDYQAYLDRDKPKAALSTPIVSSDG
jgi:hypothetical protein